jgi:tripartite-type tricarboxylate transporter receptor subunit TctC
MSASPYVVTINPKVGEAELRLSGNRRGFASFRGALQSMAHVDLLHVPYKGTGQALTDLLAGQVDVMFAPAQTVMSHITSKKLRALATTGRRRATRLPDLPTVAQSGVPGYEAAGWFGLLAPAATPKAVVEQPSRDANAVLAASFATTRRSGRS